MSIKPKTTLCERCQQPFRGKKFEVWRNDRQSPYKHHQSWQELVQAAEDGCYMCSWYIRMKPHRPEIEMILHSYDTDEERRLNLIGLGTGDKDDDGVHFVARQRTDYDANFISAWNPPVRFNGEQLSSLLSPWYENCKAHHATCASHARTHIPTRLLRLELDFPKPSIRLVETTDSQSISNLAYCTVSHRWGDARLPKIEKTNIHMFKSGFAIEDLPNSYQEAIAIAGSIGISYLWIDSLCVLQDSILDWRHEAGAMCEVYRGAEANIALAAAADDSEITLTNRDTSLLRAAFIKNSWSSDDNGEWVSDDDNQLYWVIVNNQLGHNALIYSRLIKRAWVMQELRLATRVIILGADQIYYVCRDATSCETLTGYMPVSLDGIQKNLEPPPWFTKTASCSHELWNWLVYEYSICEITNAGDRTMAIAGLARWYAEQLDDEYVAGMWRSQLPSCLLWTVEQRSSSKRAEPYRAPTWSWLSIDGPMDYDVGFLTYRVNVNLCDFVSVQIDLVDAQNPYGLITNGEIVLNGHLTPVILWAEGSASMMATMNHNTGKLVALGACEVWKDEQPLGLDSGLQEIPCKPGGSRKMSVDIRITMHGDDADRIEEVSISEYTRVYALPMLHFEVHNGTSIMVEGLLLTGTRNLSGSFLRFGAFSMFDRNHAIACLTANERSNFRIL